MKFLTFSLCSIYFLGAAQFVCATALIEQMFTLQPGWNAIYLEVDPSDGDEQTTEDRSPATVFGLPEIAMVWAHPYASTTAQYIQSPSAAGFNEAGWRVYIPEDEAEDSKAFLTNLFAIMPGQVYLVQVSGSDSITLTVRGKPNYKSIQWQPQNFNLVGFYVDPENGETFANMLNLSANQNPAIYGLDENSNWSLVDQGKHALVESGRGYWIYNDGSINQSGPLELPARILNGLYFNPASSISNLTITNRSGAGDDIVSFSVNDNFPLQYFAGYAEDGITPQWSNIESFTPTIASGKQFANLVSIDRTNLNESVGDVLTIRGMGARIRLPLGADPVQGHAGLWAGIAVLDQVTHVRVADPDNLEKTPAPMQLKLLLHVDANEQVQLLKQVYLLADNTANGDTQVRTLVTNDSCLAQYQTLNLSNREGVGYRLSSSAFDFAETALVMQGNVDGTLSALVNINADLPTHPLKHRYHVSHDDKDNSSGEVIDGDQYRSTFYDEVWDITRAVSLVPDNNIAPSPDSGMGQISGVYKETIHGIHKAAVTIQGRFLLQRLNNIETLITECTGS